MKKAFIVLDTGVTFEGIWQGGKPKAGEVVFNTSHSGYEEMATDPSYHSQILVTTAPMQGNYGINDDFWESERLWIHGFVCMQIQNSERDSAWLDRLVSSDIPVITDIDTRSLVLYLRDQGTVWGAAVQAETEVEAQEIAKSLIVKEKSKDKDWAYHASCKESWELEGAVKSGKKIAVVDFGIKKNILRELQKRCSKIKVFPSRAKAEEINNWSPDALMLSNGPGDPNDIEQAVDTVKSLLGSVPAFGICMGHHILAKALGGQTYKLKFGHRASNHPVKDTLLNKVYVTSQNHGYAVDMDSLPKNVEITHTNLNDGTVSGIFYADKNCFSVQFHPESHPGPHEGELLFDHFIGMIN